MSRAALIATVTLAWGALAPGLALADSNSPEKGQKRVEEEYLRKINFACGTQISLNYDGASLRKNNKDIGWDQTDGENECNEPLRYIHYACKTDAGKAAVKAARIGWVVCMGTPGKVGSLKVQGGTITVERAFEEDKPYERSRKQFEQALKIQLPLSGVEDPYYDSAWRDLRSQPNPVTDTKNYCQVNDKKIDFQDGSHDTLFHHKEDAKVKCWKNGELVTDLTFAKGRRSGFYTYLRDRTARRESLRDEKRHGEQKELEDGKLKSLAQYADGEEVWRKTYHPSGKLATYSRKLQKGRARLDVKEDGKITSLDCGPELKDDGELKKLCGFQGAVTTSIYDGTGKVSRIVTYKDGVIAKEAAGDSAYARGSEVAYKDGKKHGTERLMGRNGKLASIITWSDGVQDGKEQRYSEDGQKVVEESLWKKGELTQRTELFLNGNPKLRETFDGKDKLARTRYWDTGKVAEEGRYLRSSRGYGSGWAEEGVHKRYYESGKPESETSFVAGKRDGAHKSWWESGLPREEESWKAGTKTKAKAWDKDGKLVLDEEYEADGSRKLKR